MGEKDKTHAGNVIMKDPPPPSDDDYIIIVHHHGDGSIVFTSDQLSYVGYETVVGTIPNQSGQPAQGVATAMKAI